MAELYLLVGMGETVTNPYAPGGLFSTLEKALEALAGHLGREPGQLQGEWESFDEQRKPGYVIEIEGQENHFEVLAFEVGHVGRMMELVSLQAGESVGLEFELFPSFPEALATIAEAERSEPSSLGVEGIGMPLLPIVWHKVQGNEGREYLSIPFRVDVFNV